MVWCASQTPPRCDDDLHDGALSLGQEREEITPHWAHAIITQYAPAPTCWHVPDWDGAPVGRNQRVAGHALVHYHRVEVVRELRETPFAGECLDGRDHHGGVHIIMFGGNEPDAEREVRRDLPHLRGGLLEQLVTVREDECRPTAPLYQRREDHGLPGTRGGRHERPGNATRKRCLHRLDGLILVGT